jgi:hypothetical protein
MATGRGRGGVSRAGFNHAALACVSAASLSKQGIFSRALMSPCLSAFGFGFLCFHTAPRVRFLNSGRCRPCFFQMEARHFARHRR